MAIDEMVRELTLNYRLGKNGMMLMSLPFQGIPVISSYEQTQDFLYYLFWTRYVNRGALAKPHLNLATLSHANPAALALTGVRYLVTRDSVGATASEPSPVFSWNSYRIDSIQRPNIGGYGVVESRAGKNLTAELDLMRQPDFDPSRIAVLPQDDAALLLGAQLSPLANSSILLDGQSIVFSGKSDGEQSLAVLPFRFSQCWTPEWVKGHGRILRTDLYLIGVAFEGDVTVKLNWSMGYGRTNCLRADAALIPQARAAAKAFPLD
jgi:hypothetical protein